MVGKFVKLAFLILAQSFLLFGNEKSSSNELGQESQEGVRRALPPPFDSPPFPSAEYQGSPLVGVPPSDNIFPLTKKLYETRWVCVGPQSFAISKSIA